MPLFHLCMHIFQILSSSSSSAQSVFFVWLLIRIKTEMLLVLSEGSREQLMPDSYSREETKNEKSIALMIGGVTIMMIAASCCLNDTGVLDLCRCRRKKKRERARKRNF